MFETADELTELQALLDRSYASAGEHLLSIHTPNWRVPADDLVELLQGMCVLNLATVNSKGEPYIGALDSFLFHGRFFFGSSPTSLRARHIARNPAVSGAHTRGEELSVVVHGMAVPLDKTSEIGKEYRAYGAKTYGEEAVKEFWDSDTPYWSIEPKRMFALRPIVEKP
jgi:hypothetical protein